MKKNYPFFDRDPVLFDIIFNSIRNQRAPYEPQESSVKKELKKGI